MRHPGESELALYAGGELPLWRRWWMRWHLRGCESCRGEVDSFFLARDHVSETAEDFDGELNWHHLAGEMRANIQVGLQAAECVATAEEPRVRLGWRVAAALASITMVLVSGWWLHLPRPNVRSQGPLVAATTDGIAVRENSASLTLIHASADPVVFSAQTDGGLSAHYVDDDTGMVTINNVYVQ